MILVHHAAAESPIDLTIAIPVDRPDLSKRRWRATAADGREFGFDLEHHLHDGDVVHREESIAYILVQKPEPVLEVVLPASSGAAARLGWQIGNLHFLVETTSEVVRTVDDPAVRQYFQREHIAFTSRDAVFHPIANGHHH
jgi:urease accessory protein